MNHLVTTLPRKYHNINNEFRGLDKLAYLSAIGKSLMTYDPLKKK